MTTEGFPEYVVAGDRLYQIGVSQARTGRASKRDLTDFAVELTDPLSQAKERTFVGMTWELGEDFPGFRVPVPLRWLLTRFLVHHVAAGNTRLLRSDTGPVLTTTTYSDYLGEPADPDSADQAVVRVLKAWLRGGVQEPVTLSALFVSTNLDIGSLRRSVNALVVQGYLHPEQDGAYAIEPRVLALPQPSPVRRMDPSPVSRYYQEIDIQANQPFAFVMMPFAETECPQARYFEVIKPLLDSEFGVRSYRVDEDDLPDRIDNKIYTYLVHSEFVIAEVSARNPNVMYELGLAHALNKRCVLLTQNEPRELPFDVSRISVEPYADDDSLRDYLRRVVTALLGR